MSDNVVVFPVGRMDPDVLLQKAATWGMDECVVVGLRDGELCVGGTPATLDRVHWLCTRGAQFALRQVEAGHPMGERHE